MKLPTLKRARTRAWEACSKYIRVLNSDANGYCTCVTCGNRDHYKEMQAGHFTPGRGNGILFDERGIHVQCYSCNMHRAGNLIEYYPYMLKNYGQLVIDELKTNSRMQKKISVVEFLEIETMYKNKLKVIEKNS